MSTLLAHRLAPPLVKNQSKIVQFHAYCPVLKRHLPARGWKTIARFDLRVVPSRNKLNPVSCE